MAAADVRGRVDAGSVHRRGNAGDGEDGEESVVARMEVVVMVAAVARWWWRRREWSQRRSANVVAKVEGLISIMTLNEGLIQYIVAERSS